MDNTVTTLNKDWGSHFGVDLQDRQHVSSAPNASDSGFAYAFLHEHEMGEDATNSASMASSQSTDEFLHTGGSLLQHLLPPISASDSKLEQKLDDSEKMPDGWLLQDSSVSDPSHDHSASVLLHSHHDTDPLRLVHHHHHQQQQHQQHPLQHHQHHQQQHHQQHQHHGHVRDVDGPGQTHYSQHTRQMRALNDYAMSPTEYRTAMEPATGSKRPREQGAQMPQKRRMSHNATEQRRRNKIKERIEELRATVPICDSERKADILKKSVDYIKFLQQQYSDLIIKAKKLQEEYYNIGGKQDFLSPHGNHTQQQQQHQQQHHHLQHQQQHHHQHQHQHHSYHTAPSPSSSASSSSSSSSPSHLNHMGNSLSNGSILIANGSSMAHAYSLPQIQSIHYSSSPPPSSVSIPASPPLIHLQHQQQHHLHQQQQQQVLLSHVLPQHATTNGNGNMLSYSPMSSIIPSKDDKKLSPDSPSESSPDTP